jgi:LacI family transcriptional regulator
MKRNISKRRRTQPDDVKGSEKKPEQVRPATLAEVARYAGVVPMTASRAINGTGYVSEGVRKRVIEAARRLNYRPNVLARSLKQRQLHAVGILLPDIANPFSAELVTGMQEVLEARGYSSFLTGAMRSVQQEQANLNALVDHRVDGLLVGTRGTQLGNEVLLQVIRRGVPVVTVGRPLLVSSADCVMANHKAGALEMVNHLVAMGHERIAFLGVRHEQAHTLRRYRGYIEGLKRYKIPVNPEYVVGPEAGPAFATQADGYAGLLQLTRLKNPPTAVFARNDFAAIGALRAAHQLGLKVPGDIAIAGFDNIPLAEYTTPPLTTVEQPIKEQGRLAAEFLMDRIEGRAPVKRREFCFECQLIVRQSTDPRQSSAPVRPLQMLT